uniref:Uncharacterized protein n=1 Tax=Periophthalmus magnuspinnatus TaxID=409849 RepID=A0A3B3ZIY5_9GOBI
MKGPIVFLTLALVIMSMAQPAEGFLHHILRGSMCLNVLFFTLNRNQFTRDRRCRD